MGLKTSVFYSEGLNAKAKIQILTISCRIFTICIPDECLNQRRLYLEEIVDELEDIPDKAIEVSHFLMGASAVSSSLKVRKFQKVFFVS